MAIGVLDVDHSWDIDGLLVGNATGAVWKHVETKGLDLPSYRISDQARPQGHGLFFLGPDYMDGRLVQQTIAMEGVYGATYQDAMDLVKQKMSPRSTEMLLRWRYNQDPTRRLKVRPRRCEFSLDELTYHGLLVAHLEFMAADPLIYDDVETITTLNPSSTTGGLGFPHGFPHGFGSTTSTQQTVTNLGTAPTSIYGRVTASGGGISRWQLENLTTGFLWSMTITLNAGDFIDFDFNDRTVLLGGTASRSINVDRPGSTWWSLAPGDNVVSFKVDSVGGGTATVDLKDRSAWY